MHVAHPVEPVAIDVDHLLDEAECPQQAQEAAQAKPAVPVVENVQRPQVQVPVSCLSGVR